MCSSDLFDERARQIEVRVLVPAAAAEKVRVRDERQEKETGGDAPVGRTHTAISAGVPSTMRRGSVSSCTCSGVTPGATSISFSPSFVTSSTQ